MEDVRISTGTQPAYFNFANPSTGVNVLSTTAVGPSQPIPKNGLWATIQGELAGAALTAYLQGTNDPTSAAGTTNNWVNLATITLPRTAAFLGDSTTSDGAEVTSAWRWVRVYVSAITGTATFILGV